MWDRRIIFERYAFLILSYHNGMIKIKIFHCAVERKQREDDTTALQAFLNLYNQDLNITFSYKDISMRFFQNHSWKTPARLNEEAYVYLENAHKYSGSARMRYRCRMYHKPQSWEMENGLRNQYYEMWKND